MRKHLLLLGATLVGGVLFAQPRVIGVHPAHDGKLLTMENAIVGRLSPENRYYTWVNDNEYRFYDGKKWDSARLDESVKLPQATGWTALNIGNSLYITDYKDTIAVAVSNDREIVYGKSVSRNEFGINGGIFWAPSGRKLAFYRKDESRVTDFPLLNIRTRTGELRLLKYPMNGMDSEIVSLGIYDLDKGSTVYLNVPEFTPERFLTNISWSPDDKSVYVQVLDRTQHHMKLNQYCAATGEFVRTLLTEDDERWVEPLDPVRFLKGRKDLMIYRTDLRDGYRNLYLLDTLGNIRRLTPVDADVEYPYREPPLQGERQGAGEEGSREGEDRQAGGPYTGARLAQCVHERRLHLVLRPVREPGHPGCDAAPEHRREKHAEALRGG